MTISLNLSNFLSDFSLRCHASELSDDDQRKALIISIALGILTIGAFHLISFCAQRIYRVLLSPTDSTTTKTKLIGISFFGHPIAKLRGPAEPSIDFLGYPKDHLESIQKQMDVNHFPLNVCPKRPEKSYPVNQQKAQEFINNLPKAFREAAQKAIDNVQHISMDMFDKALKQCVEQLNKRLHALGNPSYTIGIVCGKSNQWVAGLALKDLSQLPNSWFSLGDRQGTVNVKIPNQDLNVHEKKEDIIVLFDDVCYSGTQLKENINRLAAVTKKKILIVVPFMTQKSIDLAYQTAKTGGADIEIFTTDTRIRCFKEIFASESERKQLEASLPATPMYFTDRYERTFCYTDWRYPDEQSIITGFGAGAMVVPNSDQTMATNLKKEDYFLPEERTIPRPYGIVI